MLCVAFCTIHIVTTAQTTGNKRSVFHFSFIPPLSTHGLLAGEYTNGASVNLLAGISRNEDAFTFGGLANVIRHNAGGLQFTGLCNYTGNNGRGMQLGGLANIVGNSYRGFLFGGLINTAKDMEGFQSGGLGNVADSLKGLQLGGLINIAGQTKGVQFGGLGNISGDMKGFQFGGLGNISGRVNGFQFGGLFNIARQVEGVQFAGLVNIAESCDYPIALLNIIRDGEYALGVSYNETGTILLTFRSGGRITYGILGVGYNYKTEGSGFTTEGGFGIHIPVTRWLRINNEIKGGVCSNFSDDPTFYTNYALLPAFRLNPHVEIFAGPSLNYLQSDDTANTKIFPDHSLWKKYGDSRLQQIYIGFQAGAHYIF